MASTRRRVKLYTLNEDRQWDDRGTGHVSSSYVEHLQGMSACTETRNAGTPERRNTETRNTETRDTKVLKPGTHEKQIN